jgi:hypothetical protein
MLPRMNYLYIALGVLFVLWLLVELRTSRPDGDLLPLAPFRRMMYYIMPTRTESLVYFDAFVDAERLEAFIEARKESGANMTHAAVAAAGMALSGTPRMNRFVSGKRLYQRKKRFLTFSMKRKRLDREAGLSTVKLEFLDGETFPAWCKRVNDSIGVERSGKRTRADKEYDLFNLLPRPVLGFAARLLARLDHYGLVPGFFIADDPLYTSIFVANLGSVGMGPGYHHLFEYGNCPLFIMVGKVEPKAVVVDGQVVARRMMHIRFTYDERIDDGLNARFGIDRVVKVLSEPDRFLSDDKAMWPCPELVAETGG